MTDHKETAARSALARLRAALLGAQPPVSRAQRVAGAATAFVAMLALAGIAFHSGGEAAGPYLVASMGASSVLLFAAPHSPLAQPWPLVGGHLVSALAGVTCAQWIASVPFAAASAVALAIGLMFTLRCLHPPGGATALIPVLGGEALRSAGYGFVLSPILANVLVLLLLALVVNNVAPGRRWPVAGRAAGEGRRAPVAAAGGGPTSADLEAALAEMGAYIDVSESDLEQIYARAVLHSRARLLGEIHCRDIMQREVTTAQFGDSLESIWESMRTDKLKGVVVVDRARRVIGIVTIVDFLKRSELRGAGSVFARLRAFLRPSPGVTTDKPETVGEIMSAPVVTVHQDAHIVTLIPLFARHAIHHLPVLDDERRLVGMVTQTELMAALYSRRAAFTAPAPR